jgi:hypothetical protein
MDATAMAQNEYQQFIPKIVRELLRQYYHNVTMHMNSALLHILQAHMHAL